MTSKNWSVCVIASFFLSCSQDDPGSIPKPGGREDQNSCQVGENGWTIPVNQIADGGVGKDGIPSIDNPQFITAESVDFMNEHELVSAVKVNGEIKAYPHRILDLHEVVNDRIGGIAIALTFCPLTGTAIAFDRNIKGVETTFGVSGLLYNANLILYDRASDTRWSQMTFEGLNGIFSCDSLSTYPVVELSWEAFKNLYPQALVLSKETGFDRNYDDAPLTSRINLNNIPFFPYGPKDDRLANYERVHSIFDPRGSTIYTLNSFSDGDEIIIDGSYMILGNADSNLIVSFQLPIGRNGIKPVPNGDGIIMEDEDGNQYDLFGEIINGPDMGFSLELTSSYSGYWFAIAAMRPQPIIFTKDQDG